TRRARPIAGSGASWSPRRRAPPVHERESGAPEFRSTPPIACASRGREPRPPPEGARQAAFGQIDPDQTQQIVTFDTNFATIKESEATMKIEKIHHVAYRCTAAQTPHEI